MSKQSYQTTDEHIFEEHVTKIYLQESEWVTQENGSKTYSGALLEADPAEIDVSGCYFQKGGLIPRAQAYKKKTERESGLEWSDLKKSSFILPLTVGRSSKLFEYISQVESAIMTLASEKNLIGNSHKLVSKLQKYESALTTKFDIDQYCLFKYHVQDTYKPLFKHESDPIPDEKSLVPMMMTMYPSSFSIVSNTRLGVYTFHVKFKAVAITIGPKLTSDEVFEEIMNEPKTAYQRAIARIMKEEISGGSKKRERSITEHQPSDYEDLNSDESSEEDEEESREKRQKRRRLLKN